MKELVKKYTKWHGNTSHKWKVAVIKKAEKEGLSINNHQDINWLYDDCIHFLTDRTTRKITNLARKMGYKQPPCHHCRMIIKHWNDNTDYKWTPDLAHLF